jgi:hypothetical protein
MSFLPKRIQMKSTSYEVKFESFTERHYIRTFAKKYKSAWDITRRIITEEFRQIDLLFLKNTAETIIDSKEIKICKTEFKIAGTQESRHGSGNRCIVAVHKDQKVVKVLLVYSKIDVKGSRETDWWRGIIKDNYSDYSNCF